MKERPIIFSAPMVRAILDGTKTQTRRVVKPQPPQSHQFAGFVVHSTCRADEGKAVWGAGDVKALLREAHRVACPYGQPGDRLWVRETWNGNIEVGVAYRSTNPELNGAPWRSPIHMPRWASRITLEITDVRVQRVQEISEADVVAEGVSTPGPFAVHHFRDVWDSINAKRGHPWASTPWVWAISFRRVEPAQ